MSNGGVSLVQSHNVHDALLLPGLADAYAPMPEVCAASRYQLTDFDLHRFSHWQHSIQYEYNYQNPFDAVFSAWQLGWSVLRDSFHERYESIQNETPSAFAQESNQITPSFESLNNTSKCHDNQNTACELRNSCQLRSCLRGCTRSNSTIQTLPQRKVTFHEQVSIYVGLDEELRMYDTVMDAFDLAEWTEKPWSRRPTKRGHDEGHPKVSYHEKERRIKPVLNSWHRTDQFYDVSSNWHHHNQPQPDEHEDPEDANHFLHEAPDSVQHLYDSLFAEGVVIGPRIHESVFLRSWYVHHLQFPQCFHPRTIEINGHWRHWFNDIISGWRDRILPAEQVIFDIVWPNPPRTGVEHEILFDIILSQGIEAPRRAGLVSICQKDDPAQRVAYSVAVSLSEVTSGHQIIQQAEYLHECNLHTCSIRNGWNRIPFTLEPIHEMQDGDSFVVTVTSATSSTTAGNAQIESQEQVQHLSDAHEPNEDTDRQAPDSPYPSPSSVESQDVNSHATIHRLGHVQITGLIRKDTNFHILQDAARIVGVPADHFLAFHWLQCEPDDHIPGVCAMILQHYLDIPPGSTEKLVLIDVEMHHPHRDESLPRAPPVSRQVHRILPTIVRQHLLQLTRTDAYCEWHQFDCLVYCNRILWNQQERGPIHTAHGMYFRIVVPPPPDITWDIGHAIRVFHDSAQIFESPIAGRAAEEIMRSGNEAQIQPGQQEQEEKNTVHSIIHLKSADLDGDIDVPMTSHRRRPERPPRPSHDGDEQWFWEFGQIFSQNAQEEAFEGEFFLYVQTWYVDHLRRPSCRRPRPIRLDHYWITWLDEFTHTHGGMRWSKTCHFQCTLSSPDRHNIDIMVMHVTSSSSKTGHLDGLLEF